MNIINGETLRQRLARLNTLGNLFFGAPLAAPELAFSEVRRQRRKEQAKFYNKLLKAASKGKLGVPTKGGQGVISRYFTANRKDQNQTAIAAGRKPTHY